MAREAKNGAGTGGTTAGASLAGRGATASSGRASGRDLDSRTAELAALLGQVFNAAKRRAPAPPDLFDEAKACENLGPRHAPVLFSVALADGLSVSEIAERIGLSVPTTSLMVGELSRAGLVTRTEDERDRRRTLVTIPPDLAGPIEEWRAELLGPIRKTLERLTPTERATLTKALTILVEENEAD
jgi:DNA-binding MarR family transcriptional regulator